MEVLYKTGTAEEIASETARKFGKCRLVVYCADDKRFTEISRRLREKMPEVKMIGTTGFMFSGSGSFADGISAIGFSESDAQCEVGVLLETDKNPIRYLETFSEAIDSIKNRSNNNVCLAFSTGSEEKVVSTMKIVLESAKVRLIGGTAGNTTAGEPKKVALNGVVYNGATVYAVIGSKLGEIRVFKENIYHKRPELHIVTNCSADNRTIYEIDGRRAMDVYMEELGYTDKDVGNGVFQNPLCRIIGADHYITAIFSFNKDRSISTYKNIFKNDMISFTDIDSSYKEFMAGNMRKLTEGSVAGILSINCILRYLYFGNNSYTGEYAQMMNKASNNCHWGIVGDGEQYIGQHINQSMVCVVFTKNGR